MCCKKVCVCWRHSLWGRKSCCWLFWCLQRFIPLLHITNYFLLKLRMETETMLSNCLITYRIQHELLNFTFDLYSLHLCFWSLQGIGRHISRIRLEQLLLFVKVSSSDWVWEDATVELILFGGRSSSTAWHNNIEQANMSHQFTRLCPILLTNYWHWHWPTTALSHIWNRRIVKILNTHKFYIFQSHT